MRGSEAAESAIGVFFTPLEWTKWVVNRYGLFEQWVHGATVFDPTAGEGNFLEAFIAIARERNIPVRRDMLERLFGIEKEERYVAKFFLKMKEQYHLAFPLRNFQCEDFILSNYDLRADILVGNPPWQNFNDLPQGYKRRVKPHFVRHHLAPRPQDLLLGSSRIDLAALVIAKSLTHHLKNDGSAFFFLPLLSSE